MTKKMKHTLTQLEDTCSSAALAVKDHLSTVASNGSVYSTDCWLLNEAELLQGYAQDVIDAFAKKKKEVK